MSTGECSNFRSHHLRPDKCKFCFGDRARHRQATTDNTQQVTGEQQKELAERDKKEGDKDEKGGVKDISELEKLVDELRECQSERAKLSAELNQLKQSNETGQGKVNDDLLEQLKRKCELLERERDEAQEELHGLEREVEEMQDSFKEEESEQFEQLKQELELATKNCKILQIRLSKAERQYGQLEQVKGMLERQLDEWTSRSGTDKNTTGQQANNNRGESLADTYDSGQTSAAAAAAAVLFEQVSADSIKLPTSEYDQLLRDLNDTSERERDLQEQVRYSQEEAQLKGERLQALESENELLLAKLEQLTQQRHTTRSNWTTTTTTTRQQNSKDESTYGNENPDELRLGLELAQAECSRLKSRCQELGNAELALRECDSTRSRLELELNEIKKAASTPTGNTENGLLSIARTQLECRKLRARLVRSERQCRQLQVELESTLHGTSRVSSSSSVPDASMKTQLASECEILVARKNELERQLERLRAEGQSELEGELVQKLKHQLEISESELARARSRLVELDLECGRAQRQHRRLLESLDVAANKQPTRRVRLPPEEERDSWGRQELRRALSELEAEADELAGALKARECLSSWSCSESASSMSTSASTNDGQQQMLKRQLDSERQANRQLKIELNKLENMRSELELDTQGMLERERAVTRDELEKLRQLNKELNAELEEARASQRAAGARLRDAQANIERLRKELTASNSSKQQMTTSEIIVSSSGNSPSSDQPVELLVRDLNELKVKNGFLVRELENAREESARQLNEQLQVFEAKEKRAAELAKLELREQHLAESQRLREELAQAKQRISASQRATIRADEEASAERERARATERDWRREKGQLQQRFEQLEGSLALERRANELRLKEAEASTRDKERELMSAQERIVQLEREVKRAAGKQELLEERERSSARDLESARRQLNELAAGKRAREQELDELTREHSSERATLLEALESTKRTYNESLSELRAARERVSRYQSESFRERQAYQERLDEIGNELARQAEQAGQTRLLKQQVEATERQIESLRRELAHGKEERARIKAKCEQLEHKCQRYERQELAAKTNSISSGSHLFRALSSRRESSSSSSSRVKFMNEEQQKNIRPSVAGSSSSSSQVVADETGRTDETNLVEQLSGKISDQRHLAQLLRRQTEELQAELRREKLARAAERAKLQAQLSQLSARLNQADERVLLDCEENLSPELREKAHRRLETKWATERDNSLAVIHQQQAQADLLERDLNRLGQAHELLRLQAKQLEAHNGKLARRLIEYQQLAPSETRARQLESRVEQLTRQNARLACILREEARPLVSLVNRIVEGLEASEKTSSLSSNIKGAQSSTSTLDSTKRPLLTTSIQNQPPDLITSCQSPVGSQSSRLSRFLGGSSIKQQQQQQQQQQEQVGESSSQFSQSESNTKKGVKKIRSKWASLGLTASERQQLRRHLEALGTSIDELEAEESSRRSRETSGGVSSPADRQKTRAVRWQPAADSSDLESNISWSAAKTSNDITTTSSRVTDQYRRFPQATPTTSSSIGGGGGGISLTDYESESSLASEISVPNSRLTLSTGTGGGADSDGGVTSLSGTKKAKRRGLKTRLTSTLRNISRSITALTSDSEQENDSKPNKVQRQNLTEIRV